MFSASDLRKGLKIQIDGEPYIITEFEFSKPGKGQALYRCKLRNMISGNQQSWPRSPPGPEHKINQLSFLGQQNHQFDLTGLDVYCAC